MSNLVINANSIYDRVIRIGRQTENLVSSITFNVQMWIDEYGTGECVLNVRRNGDGSAYIVPMTITDGMTTWTITDTDTSRKGRGKIQLKYTTGEKVKTSHIFTISCSESLIGEGEPPSGHEDWLTELNRMTAEVEAAKTSASASAQTAQTAAGTAAEKASEAAQSAEFAYNHYESARQSAVSAQASKTGAVQAAANAHESATEAAQSATMASVASTAAESAKQAAQTAEINAQGFAQTASAKASEASASAQTAQTAAGTAAEKATEAEQSANTASGFANNASASAESANASAQAAAQSAQSASVARTAAEAAAISAQAEAEDAEAAKTAAQTAEASAQGFAQTASEKASQAAESASQAQESVTDAQAEVIRASAEADRARTEAEQAASRIYDFLPTETASGPVASFEDGANNVPLKSLVVDIEPVQDTSSGVPSPDNICPISGWTGMTVNANGTEIPISWESEAGTVYGGMLDVTNGVLTVDRAIMDLGTLTWNYVASTALNFRASELIGANPPATACIKPNAICSILPVLDYTAISTPADGITIIFATSVQAGKVWAHSGTYTDATAFKSAVTGHMLVYELATPIAYQLTPNEVKSILGANNIYADTGDTAVTYRADVQKWVEKKLSTQSTVSLTRSMPVQTEETEPTVSE